MKHPLDQEVSDLEDVAPPAGAPSRRLAEAVLARDPDLAVPCLAAHYRLTAQLCNFPGEH
jgi:hypothetical protein